MDIKIVDASGVEQGPSRSDEHHDPGQSSYSDSGELNRIAVAQVLDMELKDIEKNKNKIDDLITWAKDQMNEENPTQLKWLVRNLEARLGSPNFGETRIAKLSRYAYLDMEGKRMEAEKMSLVK